MTTMTLRVAAGTAHDAFLLVDDALAGGPHRVARDSAVVDVDAETVGLWVVAVTTSERAADQLAALVAKEGWL